MRRDGLFPKVAMAAAMLVAAGGAAQALTREEGMARAQALTREAAKNRPVVAKPTYDPLDPNAPWQARFEAIDADHDRRITRDEARAHANRRFEAMDTNHDGKVDAAEWAEFHRPRGKAAPTPEQVAKSAREADADFAAADTNRDGQIDRAEALAAVESAFGRADVNRRGAIFDWEYRRFAW